MVQTNKRVTQRGAVSLFVVIFTALLITVVTVGFVRIMIQNQEQSSVADLSRSAYDSAQAGVEDAKRALVSHQETCTADAAKCATENTVIDAGQCNTLQNLHISTGDKEVIIKQSEGDSALQQAYTCVTMKLNSPDYLGTLDEAQSTVVPLRGVSDFDRVSVEWFMKSDLKDPTKGVDVANTVDLPKKVDWSPSGNRPALVRSQLIQYGTSFSLTDFDNIQDGKSNANTLFLYPSAVGLNSFNYTDDARRSQTANVLQQVSCSKDFTTTLYACKAMLVLPQAIGQNDNTRGGAYMRLNAIYTSGNNFRVKLYNGNTPVDFNGVQAVVDSTGRANDQFRRVESRVELDVSAFPYPDAAVDVTGNLCKDFLVTDNPTDYVANTDECDPTTYKTAS